MNQGGGGSDRDAILSALARLETAQAALADLTFDALTAPELLTITDRLETVYRRQPTVNHRLLQQLTAHTTPTELGATSWPMVLSTRLRISRGQARRRLEDAEDLGPRAAISGEPLPPVRAHTAHAQAAGQIGAEHLRIIGTFFAALPDAVDFDTREAAEATLARVASEQGPAGLRQAADRLLAHLHPDGDYTDADRARRRGLTLGKQGPDGMSPIRGWLDPEARATLDAVFAKLAAPGRCNPPDQTPPAWMGPRPRPPPRPTGAPQHSATTTPSTPSAAACSPPASSASTTGYRSASSSPPPSQSWNPDLGGPSPAAAPCSP
jgi:hypothetical protein